MTWKHRTKNKQVFLGIIRRQTPVKSDVQTSALMNHHPEGRAHSGLTFKGKVEIVRIGCYCSNSVRKSYHLTLILFHKTAGEKSKMIENNNKDCNALINHLCKQHSSLSSPTSSVV